MSNFSWKVVASIFGLRLIPMRVMPKIYDNKAILKFRFLWMFVFYIAWVCVQLMLLIIWLAPLDLLSDQFAFKSLIFIFAFSGVIALIFSFLDYNVVVKSEGLLNRSDEESLTQTKTHRSQDRT